MNNEQREAAVESLTDLQGFELKGFLVSRFPRAENDPEGIAFEDYFLLIQEIFTVRGPEEKAVRKEELEERGRRYGFPEQILHG